MTRLGSPTRVIAALSFLLLAGCGWIPPVALTYPATDRTVQCEGDMYPLFDPEVARLLNALQQNCVNDYRRQGYELSRRS